MKKVMFIDDALIMLRSMKLILGEFYEVECVSSGREALEKLNHKYRPDIIFLDFEMPEMNGSTTFDRIREIEGLESVPVVFLTGTDDKETIVKILIKKPNGYLLKPSTRDKLIQLIENLTHGLGASDEKKDDGVE